MVEQEVMRKAAEETSGGCEAGYWTMARIMTRWSRSDRDVT